MPSKNDTMQSYILVGIEKSTIGNAGVHADKSAPELHALNSASEIRISDLFNAVKSRDNAFNPKPVNKEFINLDGKPKIFYHGTPNGTFTEFRDWQYFTPNEDYAGNYLNQGASSNGYKKNAS